MAPVSNVFASVFGDLVLEPLPNQTTSALGSLDHLFDQSLQAQWRRVGAGQKKQAQIPAPLTRWMQPRENWVKTTKECLDLLQESIEYYRDATKVMADRWTPERAQTQGMREVWALISSQIPVDYFVYALTQVIVWVGSTQMDIVRPGEYEGLSGDAQITLETLQVLIKDLQLTGLGGERTAIAYAKATDTLLHLYVRRYRPDPDTLPGPSDYFGMLNVEQLLEFDFVPKIKKLMVLSCSMNGDLSSDANGFVSIVDATRIKQLGCDKFAHLMASKLYKIITGGHIEKDEDLRQDYQQVLATTAARNLMSKHLQHDLAYHLLQPEVSTVEVIDVYVQVINALRQIDPSNVLLERVAGQIKAFLDTRDDAVRIVVSSLLQPGVSEDNYPNPSTEHFSGQVGRLMHEYIDEERALSADMNTWVGKDLRDLNWEPEPIDAGPNYHKSRHYDAMGHMVTLKNSDEFAEELKALLQERLLNTDALNFEQEERLVTMFQLRFTDLRIPECEIMLKDMQDSRGYHTTLQIPEEFQAKILSRVYWPDPEPADYVLPWHLSHSTRVFDTAYARICPARTLQWHPSWARVTVELELEDRTFSEEVSSAQAAVIHQFQDPTVAAAYDATAMQEDTPIIRTIDQIATALNMDKDLVHRSLHFWTQKLILQAHPAGSTTYRVIESLSLLSTPSSNNTTSSNTALAQAQAVAAAAPSPPAEILPELKTGLDEILEQKELYTNFITSMLTNQGDMPASRMHMMLRMIMPNGFPYEEAEFVEFLEGLGKEGVVRRAGGLWQIGSGRE